MAYVKNDDEELQQAPEDQGPEKVLTPESAVSSSSGGAPAQQQTTPGKAKGTGWTNLVDYVNANRDQGQQMAKSVASGVQSEVDSANKSATAYESGSQPQIDAGVQVVRNPRPPAKQSSSGGGVSSGGIGSATPTRTTYAGPKNAQDIRGFQEANAAVASANTDADALNSQEGLQGVLRQQYGRSNYTPGEQRLDSFLVGAAGAPELQQSQQNAAAAKTGWADLLSRVGANVADVQDEEKRNAKYLGKRRY